LGDPSIDGRIILRWVFKKWDGASTGLICLRIETCCGRFEEGNGPSGSIKCGELID